jgi:hypothetical protein
MPGVPFASWVSFCSRVPLVQVLIKSHDTPLADFVSHVASSPQSCQGWRAANKNQMFHSTTERCPSQRNLGQFVDSDFARSPLSALAERSSRVLSRAHTLDIVESIVSSAVERPPRDDSVISPRQNLAVPTSPPFAAQAHDERHSPSLPGNAMPNPCLSCWRTTLIDGWTKRRLGQERVTWED